MFEDLGIPPLDPAEDRVMICGSPGMLRDLKHMLEGRGFVEGNTIQAGRLRDRARVRGAVNRTACPARAPRL